MTKEELKKDFFYNGVIIGKTTMDWEIAFEWFYTKLQTEQKLQQHGGKRINAGRPKLNKSQKKEPTKVMRIPISKVEQVRNMIKNL